MHHRAALPVSLALGLLLAACNSHPITFQPTTPLVEQRDEVKQDEVVKTPIDILFVVDNSGSMEEEQNNLTANFGQFIDLILLTPADFRIAVISTDMTNDGQSGRFLAKAGNDKILSRNTPRLREVFTENAKLGTMGDGFETIGYALDWIRKSTLLRVQSLSDTRVPIVSMSINSGQLGYDYLGNSEANQVVALGNACTTRLCTNRLLG